MSPAPAKTSDDAVIAAAKAIIKDGTFSMQELAAQLGISAPALYKRFPHKDAILDGVVIGVMSDLQAAIAKHSDLIAMGRAYRAFAKRQPALYSLMFADRNEGPGVQEARVAAVAPLFRLLPEKDRLTVARMLTAFLHGFVSMELAQQFKLVSAQSPLGLGGNVQDAFESALEKIVKAI